MKTILGHKLLLRYSVKPKKKEKKRNAKNKKKETCKLETEKSLFFDIQDQKDFTDVEV